MIAMTAADLADLGAVAAALAVVAAPTVIALARDAESPGMVILLTLLGATLPLAYIMAFALPRRIPQGRRLPQSRPWVPGCPPAQARSFAAVAARPAPARR